MRLKCLKTTANLVPVDTFIYLPKKKAFFFVDDKDYIENKIIFYFEEGINEKNGNMIEKELVFNENDIVLIVSQYEVNSKELIEEINSQANQQEKRRRK